MRKSLCFLAGLAVMLCLLELLLRLLPVGSAMRMQPSGAAQPFMRFVPDQPYTYSYGWAMANARRGVFNHDGYNNSELLREGQPVLIIGDSYIESLMLPYAQTLQGRLSAALGGGVAAVSASGNNLADSLEIIRTLAPQYHPHTVVMFVESGDVRNLLQTAIPGHSNFTLKEGWVDVVHHPYLESKLKMGAARSALVRYVYYNLKLSEWWGSKIASPAPATAPEVPAQNYPSERVLDFYLAQLRQVPGCGNCRFIFLVDGDRHRIYAGQDGQQAWDGDRARFLRAVRSAGFVVGDLQPLFEQDWRLRREHMDFMPLDAHWNAHGHELAAQLLLPLLREASR